MPTHHAEGVPVSLNCRYHSGQRIVKMHQPPICIIDCLEEPLPKPICSNSKGKIPKLLHSIAREVLTFATLHPSFQGRTKSNKPSRAEP